MKQSLTLLATLLLVTASALADDGKPPSRGLSFFANAGGFWADKVTANFYSGRPGNENTIDRILHSNTYGRQIWDDLLNQRLITSAVGSYEQLQVVEYPDMYYRTSYQVGLGIRYDYSSGFGWLLRFDLSRLQAIGAFNLSANGGTGILGSNQYVPCQMLGVEERINIDFALAKTVKLNTSLDLELNLGASLINTKVKDNRMKIGSSTYSILNIWDDRIPDVGVEGYEYINQGGVGYGVFISALVGYSLPGIGALKLGYTCYQSRIVLKGYTAWGWHHMLGVRIEMYNFSFL